MNYSADKDKELLEKIEAYFECTLSDEEELDLRRRVCFTDLRHPAVDEARALMGFACQPLPRRDVRNGRLRFLRWATVSIAAAAIAAIVWLPLSRGESHCYAYVDGLKVTDEEVVMALLESNIREAGESEAQAEREMMTDLSSVAGMVEIYESDDQLYL